MKENLKKIDELIKVIDEYELTEIKYKNEDLKIKLKKERSVVLENNLESIEKSVEKESFKFIKSNGIGECFYNSKIKIGEKVKVGEEIGNISIMGVKTPIISDISGEIVEILVKNGMNADYGKNLIKVKA